MTPTSPADRAAGLPVFPPGARVYSGSTPCVVAAVGFEGERWYMVLDKHGVVSRVPQDCLVERKRWAPVDKGRKS
jgi:hypothetical protein